MLHGAGGDAMNALVYEWRSLSASSQHGVKALSDLYEAMWQDVVATAVDAGLLAGDARVIKRCVLGSMNLTVQWYRPDGRLAPDAFIEAMLQACRRRCRRGGRVAAGTGGRRLGGVFPTC